LSCFFFYSIVRFSLSHCDALCSIVTIDIEELQKDILTAYDTDPAVQSFCADSDNSKYLRWSVDNVGFVQINQRILVPDCARFNIICYKLSDIRPSILLSDDRKSFVNTKMSGDWMIMKTLKDMEP
jgi:hypothetical protein